jgi:hypothetical protein
MIAITCLTAAVARTGEDESCRRWESDVHCTGWRWGVGLSIAELWRTACAQCGGEVVRLVMTCEVPNPGKTDFEAVRQ